MNIYLKTFTVVMFMCFVGLIIYAFVLEPVKTIIFYIVLFLAFAILLHFAPKFPEDENDRSANK